MRATQQPLNEQIPDGIETLGDSLTPEIIGNELVKAGFVPDLGGFRLEPIPRNPDRRDFRTRPSFRVIAGNRVISHLTIGRELEDLWRRSREFAAACPEMTARPLFLHQTERIDYLGVEYIEGADFETLARQGALKTGEARALIGKLVSDLESTLQDSTVAAASGELEAFFDSLCKAPLFIGLDQRFLSEFVFPLIRQGMRASPAQTRWTNGDFIPCNIRVDLQGRPRLVDYEFASRTHFHGEDALRWSFFNKELPNEIRSIVPFGGTSYAGSEWLEAYFLLRQMLLSAETNASKLAVDNTAAYVRDRLLRLVSVHQNGFRSSLFYSRIFAQLPGAVDSSPSGIAQLFWSSDGTFTDEESCRLPLPNDKRTLLRFKLPVLSGSLRLRFDPADATGLVRISAIRVHLPRTGQTLFAVSGQTGWEALNLGSGLHHLSGSTEFNLLSSSADPFLLLPVLDIGPAGQEIAVDVGMCFTPKLDGLLSLLAPPPPLNVARASQQLVCPQADSPSPSGGAEMLMSDLVAVAIGAAELRQSAGRLEEAGGNLAALETTIGARREDLLAAEKTFREALQDQSEKMAKLTANNSAYVESLLAQNAEIRRLEAVNRAAGEALIELRDQLTSAQRWLGNLRNRAFVRLSLAIHREKWPL